MRFSISKQFEFSASHQLLGLPDDHQCARLHGHNYRVEVVLEGPLNSVGFVRDYGDLKFVKQWIDATLDHRHLNDIMEVNPTAEHMAAWLFEQFSEEIPEMVAVRVSETGKTWAEARL